MNTNENPQNTAILNQLILLVLTLILVCLVLLVVRAYMKPAGDGARAEAAESVVPEEEPIPVVIQPPPKPKPLPTNRLAKSVTRTELVLTPSLAPTVTTSTPAYELPNVGTVRPVDFTAAGVPRIFPISGVDERGVVTEPVNAEVFGVVTLLDTPPPEMAFEMNPSCARINPRRLTTRHYVVNAEGGLANVFVHIAKGIRRKYAPPATPVVLDQVGCLYEPYVLGLQTGQRLQVRNSDPELHNVHIMPRFNREQNFAQALRGQVNTVSFDTAEALVRVKCDVHPWMFAYVGVVDHPFFSVTDTNGVFRLPKGLPTGRYTLHATHLKAGTLAQEFDHRNGDQRALHFQFVLPAATQAQRRP